ncbi:hypothetical protein LTR49_002964 [Elasticomyces elasticus]|nr:hypothetical protein LTR49_002964 [Elasticomyces elasticus]KAK5748265.1 hypothetical protein LTS12_021666 [Elasticomyces elasticus]
MHTELTFPLQPVPVWSTRQCLVYETPDGTAQGKVDGDDLAQLPSNRANPSNAILAMEAAFAQVAGSGLSEPDTLPVFDTPSASEANDGENDEPPKKKKKQVDAPAKKAKKEKTEKKTPAAPKGKGKGKKAAAPEPTPVVKGGRKAKKSAQDDFEEFLGD